MKAVKKENPMNVKSVEQAAIDWVLHFSLDDGRDSARGDFEKWLQADERHLPAFLQAEQVWLAMENMPAKLGDSLDQQLLKQLHNPAPDEKSGSLVNNWARRTITLLWRPSLAVAAAILLLLVLFDSGFYSAPSVQHYSTSVAEIGNFAFEDGSRVTLGGRSSLHAVYSESERRTILNSGEAFFDISKDSGRPFLVNVSDIQIQVLGTKFNVHHWNNTVRIGVVDGEVRVTGQTPEKSIEGTNENIGVTLVANQELVITNSEFGPVLNSNASEFGSWRSGRLVYNGATLAEVIDDANRYSTKPIVLLGDHLSSLEVMTAYRTDQIEKMLENLALALSLTVIKSPEGIVVKKAPIDAEN